MRYAQAAERSKTASSNTGTWGRATDHLTLKLGFDHTADVSLGGSIPGHHRVADDQDIAPGLSRSEPAAHQTHQDA